MGSENINTSLNVAVIGASRKPDRYSNKAVQLLVKKGHKPFPISKFDEEILGIKAYNSLSEISDQIDTVTMYVGPRRQDRKLIEDISNKHPRRVIFNPGTENPELYDKLTTQGIKTMEACTLVLLNTGQF